MCSTFQALAEPVPLGQQHWPDGTVPVVSICCIAYNHSDFIREAIHGFLIQETTFPVEILIHDDASTDGTAKIVTEYEKRYPRLIRGILQKENQYSQGKRPGWILQAEALGRYIALCEGDDFWTDASKLQKQVDYLDSHPEAILSFHDVRVVDEEGREVSRSKIEAIRGKAQKWTLAGLEDVASALIPTLSIVYRNTAVRLGSDARRIVNGDIYLFALLAEHGEMHGIRCPMGAHRRHGGGIWTSASSKSRRSAGLETRLAIARNIGSRNAAGACKLLASTSLRGVWLSLKVRDIRESARCLRYYGASIWVLCTRRNEVNFCSFARSLSVIIITPFELVMDKVAGRDRFAQ